MSKQRGLRALVLLTCLLLVPLPAAPAAGQARPEKLFLPQLRQLAPTRPLVIVSDRDGLVELYVVSSNGTVLRRLTNSPEQESAPAWSPDGQLIAFERTSVRILPSRYALHTIRADGTGERRLAPDLPGAFGPAWSPDGAWIAFNGTPTTDAFGDLTQRDIFVVGRDGAGLRQLTDTPAAVEMEPAWSPDGTRLAFVEPDELRFELFIAVIGADGTGRRRISTIPGVNPAWSPDGAWIAFSGREGGSTPDRTSIFAQPVAGGPHRLLASCEPGCYSPAWSPDGSQVAFVEYFESPGRGPWVGLTVVGADGAGRARILDALIVGRPRWSPDGQSVAVEAAVGSTTHVLVVNRDGSDARSLGPGTQPSWAP